MAEKGRDAAHRRQAPRIPDWRAGSAALTAKEVVVRITGMKCAPACGITSALRARRPAALERKPAPHRQLQSEIREYYFDYIVTGNILELRNIAAVAEIIIRSAMLRRESRGLHYTLDYPETDRADPPRDTLLRRG